MPLPSFAAGEAILNKVPSITLVFWIIKIMATTVGETAADYLAFDLGFGAAITDAVMLMLLVAALAVQLRSRRYVAWVYWIAVLLVSIVGTQLTDALTDALGVSLYASTAIFALLLAATFAAWYRSEGTLSIATILRGRREVFYWFAVLLTFALGTAAGDLFTEELDLGFQNGVFFFGGTILATFAVFQLGGNATLTFWIAYILTRPLGASLGDLLSQPQADGGLGLGFASVNIAFFGIIFALISMLSNQAGQAAAERQE